MSINLAIKPLKTLSKPLRLLRWFCYIATSTAIVTTSMAQAAGDSKPASSLCSEQFLDLDTVHLAKSKSELESQFETIFPELVHLKWLLFKASPLKLSGQDLDLKWQDIEYLRLSVEEIKKFRLTMLHDSKQNLLDRFLMESLLHHSNYSTIRQARNKKIEGVSPGKVKLLKNYFSMITALNKYLPKDKALLFSTFGKLDSKKSLVEEAEELVRLQDETAAAAFKARTGLTITEAIDGLFQSSLPNDLIRQQVSQEISKGNLGFAMARPESSRYWLMNGSDFENTRETKSSQGGEYGQFYLNQLEQAESTMLNVDQVSYQKAGNSIKPKYGFPFFGTLKLKQIVKYTIPRRYGDDFYIFKRQKILNRVTVYFEDSFSKEKHKVFYTENYFSVLIDMDKWPDTLYDKDDSIFNQPKGKAEIQIWGPLDITDVEAFVFILNPPDQEFYKFLNKNGIKVLDGRNSDPVIWKPSILSNPK